MARRASDTPVTIEAPSGLFNRRINARILMQQSVVTNPNSNPNPKPDHDPDSDLNLPSVQFASQLEAQP